MSTTALTAWSKLSDLLLNTLEEFHINVLIRISECGENVQGEWDYHNSRLQALQAEKQRRHIP